MFHATTILAYKGKNKAVIGGDGQVSFGNTVLKGNATKIRTLYKGQILAGFAGSTADAFNLFDMFEAHLETCKGDLLKSVIAFSKEWRKDKYLRRLEAMMIVLNKEKIFILSGNGDVVEPEDGLYRGICKVGGKLGNIREEYTFPDDPVICNKQHCSCVTDVMNRKERIFDK
jgi:ATP-dependent HslUV protease subunit HslV